VTFPVYFHIFGLKLHAHEVMEFLGYTLGFQLYIFLRRRIHRDPIPAEANLWIIVGCIFGALVGSKLLAIAESFHQYWDQRQTPLIFLSGQTIVGGLGGGWAGVEIAKYAMGIRRKTGDIFVFPLIVGMSVGRVGCFLTGLADQTHGIATNLPWGVDFGDGIHRHPTQLYEIAFLLLLGTALKFRMRRPWRDGDLFRMFALAYFLWRFLIDFIKPHDVRNLWLGVSPIQWFSLAGAAFATWQLLKSPTGKENQEPDNARSPLPVL
jgi:prolipoprotein diacylglyceryltransferase